MFSVDRHFADDGVGNDIELACGEGAGNGEIERTGEAVFTERGAHAGDGDAHFIGDGGDSFLAFAIGAFDAGGEVAVGKLGPTFLAADNMELLFDAGVEGVEIGERNGPIVAGAAGVMADLNS